MTTPSQTPVHHCRRVGGGVYLSSPHKKPERTEPKALPPSGSEGFPQAERTEPNQPPTNKSSGQTNRRSSTTSQGRAFQRISFRIDGPQTNPDKTKAPPLKPQSLQGVQTVNIQKLHPSNQPQTKQSSGHQTHCSTTDLNPRRTKAPVTKPTTHKPNT